MARGIGVVIRRAERNHPDLAALAAAFVRNLPGEVHLQLFVTPAGTNNFGWHYDVEDVFIVQTAGAKDCYFRENTVDRDRPRDALSVSIAVLPHETPRRGQRP
jgi:ribosomal protein L16 Arg81 hydroxylase